MSSQTAHRMYGRIIKFLSHPAASLLVTFAAVGGRAIQLVYFYNIRVDASYQVMATQNMVEGHGCSIARVFGADLSQIIYQPLINWPPGYSLLLAPFYIVTGKNYVAAGITLDILAAFLLIIAARRLLILMKVRIHLVNLFTLVSGFFIYYFYFIASSDAIAISFFIAALYIYFRIHASANRLLLHSIILGLILTLCGSIKYLFIPVIFIPPILLLVEFYANGNRQARKAGMISFSIVIVSMACLFFYQKLMAGSAGYISQAGRGFFPLHLAEAYPFLPAAVLNPDTMGIILMRNVTTNSGIYQVFQLVHLVLLFVLAAVLIKFLRARSLRKPTITLRFAFLVFLVSVVITLVLAFLSLRVEEEEITPGFFWTYMEEARYFGLPVLLMQMALFVYISRKGMKNILLFILCLFLAMETARGIFFDARRIVQFRQEEYSWQHDLAFQRYAESILKNASSQWPGVPRVVTGSAAYLSNRVSIYSGIPIVNERERMTVLQQPKAKRPVLMLVILHASDLSSFHKFISGGTVQFAGKFDQYSLYLCYVSPGE